MIRSSPHSAALQLGLAAKSKAARSDGILLEGSHPITILRVIPTMTFQIIPSDDLSGKSIWHSIWHVF